MTGIANPNLEPFDRLMTSFLEEHKVPGASLAVTRSGKLVYARGFGYSDVETKEPVQPAALFRIASVSKPVTGVAVMQLVERKKLKLDDKVLDRMKLTPFLPADAMPDPRWKQITVRHCLQHTGGWDREKSFDPVFQPGLVAKGLGIKPPTTPTQIVQYVMGQPLDFGPGERHAYSNLGYLVLGRIIEAVTGQSYELYVKKEVLAPLGIKRMRLGQAWIENRSSGEVRYYDTKKRKAPALYLPLFGQQVPIQYGGDNFEAFEAHGGWIASAVDLVKLATEFDNPAKCRILSAKSIEEMWARPDGKAGYELDGKPKDVFYGCGWSVRPVGKTGKLNTWHVGIIAGTGASLVRRWDGVNWAVLFNTDESTNGKYLVDLIDDGLHQAANNVKSWPKTDQFGAFLK